MWRRGTSDAGGQCTLCSSAVSMQSVGSRRDEEASLCGHTKNNCQNIQIPTRRKFCLDMCLTFRRPERWERDWQRGSRKPQVCRSVWSCPSPRTPANNKHLSASALRLRHTTRVYFCSASASPICCVSLAVEIHTGSTASIIPVFLHSFPLKMIIYMKVTDVICAGMISIWLATGYFSAYSTRELRASHGKKENRHTSWAEVWHRCRCVPECACPAYCVAAPMCFSARRNNKQTCCWLRRGMCVPGVTLKKSTNNGKIPIWKIIHQWLC